MGSMDEMLGQIAHLLGSNAQSVHELSSAAWLISLTDGRRVVIKRVPRQEVQDWRPGSPWTELVAIDFLSSEGLPVPKLLAADLNHGWLAREYVEGYPLNAPIDKQMFLIYRALVHHLHQIEQALQTYRHELGAIRWWNLQPSSNPLRWAQLLEGHLLPDVRSAWRDLAAEAAVGAVQVGPLDVQAANAVWDGEITWFIDWATIGQDYRERRLVAYAQAAYPAPVTVLDAEVYQNHAQHFGTAAACWLAFWDLAFWGVAFVRAKASHHQEVLRETEKRELQPDISQIVDMWRRYRLDDARVAAVQSGLML